MSNASNNIILTGLPRSGTTLTCHLLNKVPDVVALHEPMALHTLNGFSKDEVVRAIDAFFGECRHSLLTDGTAPSKVENGVVPDNPFGDLADATGNRRKRVSPGLLHVSKPLTADVRVAVKHPATFSALLPLLTEYWPCFTIVRNPLATLLSWHSLPELPISQGRQPMGEQFDPSLADALDALDSVVDRQFFLLDWNCSRYVKCLEPAHIIPYERIVGTGGSALSVIDARALGLREELATKNDNRVYDRGLVSVLAERLAADDGAWRTFYSTEDVEALAAQLLATPRVDES